MSEINLSKSSKYRRRLKAFNEGFLHGSSDSEDSGNDQPQKRLRAAAEGSNVQLTQPCRGDSNSDSELSETTRFKDGESEYPGNLQETGSISPPLGSDALPHESDELAQATRGSGSDSSSSEGEESGSSSASPDNTDLESEEESESDDRDVQEEDPSAKPLYGGARITILQSVLAIMTLCFTHSLTGLCVSDILALIAIHCPADNVCVKSLYKLKKIFTHLGKDILVFHYFCAECFKYLPKKESICPECGEGCEKSFFLEIPFVKQLQVMFQRLGFFQSLQYRFQRKKINSSNIEDIYDGNIYKQELDDGFLKNPHNISFMWYSDGVSVYKSSKFSIWPFYLMINGLSYKERTKKQNILLAGLWFGAVKPHVNLFLKSFHSALKKFSEVGSVFEVSDGSEILVKGKLLCGTCDLPAKSMFLRFKQFNGEYGWAHCKAPSQRFSKDENVRVYPYTANCALRTNNEIPALAKQAVINGTAAIGVKGPSLLYDMVPDMVWSTAIDAMHGIFLGVGKLLCSLWFEPKYATQRFSMYQMLDVIDNRLNNLSPPSFVPRLPRKIRQTLALWKALEFKLWLMYYSVPVLIGIMEEEYLQHHLELVSAIYLLRQRSISSGQIQTASLLLNSYVKKFQTLYDLRFLGMNVHQLIHLPDIVQSLGPLWVYSCFVWEDLNGKLGKLFHGSRHVAFQICSTAYGFLKLESLIEQLHPGPVRAFCERLTHVRPNVKVAEVICDKIYAVGTFSDFNRDDRDTVERLLHRYESISGGRCQSLNRLRLKGVMYTCENYSRPSRTTSHFVAFKSSGARKSGSVKHFIRWSQCDCHKKCTCQPALYFCKIDLYERVPWIAQDIENVRLAYISKVQQSGDEIVVPVSALECLCFYVAVKENDNDSIYIIEPVNLLESE